jgi:hypothetical protein
MKSKCDFYLTSLEYDALKEPRECWNIGRVSNAYRNDLMIVKAIPPISDFTNTEEELILASRHDGNDIFLPKEYPVHVYVVKPKINIKNGDIIKESESVILYWGEIYLTKKEAIDKKF